MSWWWLRLASFCRQLDGLIISLLPELLARLFVLIVSPTGITPPPDDLFVTFLINRLVRLCASDLLAGTSHLHARQVNQLMAPKLHHNGSTATFHIRPFHFYTCGWKILRQRRPARKSSRQAKFPSRFARDKKLFAQFPNCRGLFRASYF